MSKILINAILTFIFIMLNIIWAIGLFHTNLNSFIVPGSGY